MRRTKGATAAALMLCTVLVAACARGETRGGVDQPQGVGLVRR